MPVTIRVVQIEPWANTHLDTVCTGFGQRQSSLRRGNIATDHIDLRELGLDLTHPVEHIARVTVGSIDHQHIHSLPNQGNDTFIGIGTGTTEAPTRNLP